MGRNKVKLLSKGSQYWIRMLTNDRSLLKKFASEIKKHIPNVGECIIEWVSPLEEDDFCEYDGDDMLRKLCIHRSLLGFWPIKTQGSQWDALGYIECKQQAGCSDQQVDAKRIFLLVEAKAHKDEMKKGSTGATSPASLAIIRNTFSKTQKHLGATPINNWTTTYYQFANRLAHLFIFKEEFKLDAYLIFLNIINDCTYKPTSRRDMEDALQQAKVSLGVDHSSPTLEDFGVIELFFDVASKKFI